MTIPEFLERLRQIDARWHLEDSTDLRCEAGDCPITRVAQAHVHEAFSPDAWEHAAVALDLDYEDAEAIVYAADLSDDYDDDLRDQLLAATIFRTAGRDDDATQ